MNRVLYACVALLALAGSLHAAPLPPDALSWNFSWTPDAPSVVGDQGVGGVTFTKEPTKTIVGSSDIVATNLRTFSIAPAGSPESFGMSGFYGLTIDLDIVQDGTPFSGSLYFTGKLGGTFSSEGSGVSNTFLDAGPKSVVLGAYTFTVTLTSFTPPGPPSQNNTGSIGAFVEVSSIRPDSVPEPSTLVLSCLGGVALVGGAYRRWRARATPSQA